MARAELKISKIHPKDTYVLNIFYSNFWQLAEEVLVLFAAWRLSQAHSSLVE